MFSLNNTLLKPSRILLIGFSGVHVAAFLSVSIVDLSALVTTLYVLFISFHCLLFYRPYISLSADCSIVRVYWDVDSEMLRFQQRNGEWLDVESFRQQAVLPFAVLLRVNVEQRYLPLFVIICSDACNKQDFRRLRVNCLLQGGEYFNARKSLRV